VYGVQTSFPRKQFSQQKELYPLASK